MLMTVDKYAFSWCEELKEVTFSNNLESIGRFAFFKTGIERAEFPASLRIVAQAAFAKCKSLKTVKFNEGLEVLGINE